jgi:hypothetical protein
MNLYHPNTLVRRINLFVCAPMGVALGLMVGCAPASETSPDTTEASVPVRGPHPNDSRLYHVDLYSDHLRVWRNPETGCWSEIVTYNGTAIQEMRDLNDRRICTDAAGNLLERTN